MNRKILTYLIPVLATAMITLASCSNEDDLGEIFIDRNWKLSYFREGKTDTPVSKDYTVRFRETTFSATTPNGAIIEGYWKADNKKRTLQCTQVLVSNGSISGDTIATKMKTFFEKATGYGGDANYLQIKQQTGIYMQFHNR